MDLLDQDPIKMETFYSPAALRMAREPWAAWALDLLRTLVPGTDWDEAMVEDTHGTVEVEMRTALARLLRPGLRGTEPNMVVIDEGAHVPPPKDEE
jgi:hypothetical protein